MPQFLGLTELLNVLRDATAQLDHLVTSLLLIGGSLGSSLGKHPNEIETGALRDEAFIAVECSVPVVPVNLDEEKMSGSIRDPRSKAAQRPQPPVSAEYHCAEQPS